MIHLGAGGLHPQWSAVDKTSDLRQSRTVVPGTNFSSARRVRFPPSGGAPGAPSSHHARAELCLHPHPQLSGDRCFNRSLRRLSNEHELVQSSRQDTPFRQKPQLSLFSVETRFLPTLLPLTTRVRHRLRGMGCERMLGPVAAGRQPASSAAASVDVNGPRPPGRVRKADKRPTAP